MIVAVLVAWGVGFISYPILKRFVYPFLVSEIHAWSASEKERLEGE